MCPPPKICPWKTVKTWSDVCKLGVKIIRSEFFCGEPLGWNYDPAGENIYEEVPKGVLEKMHTVGMLTRMSQPGLLAKNGEFYSSKRKGCRFATIQRAMVSAFCTLDVFEKFQTFLKSKNLAKDLFLLSSDDSLPKEDLLITTPMQDDSKIPDESFIQKIAEAERTNDRSVINALFPCSKTCMNPDEGHYHCLTWFSAPKPERFSIPYDKDKLIGFSIMDTQWGRTELLWKVLEEFCDTFRT